MKWKILACDLDGTLIGWDHKINPRDLDAVRRARDSGLHVAICTGRNSRECAGVIGALELSGLGVFVNGAMVCDLADGHAIHSTCLPDELVAEVVDFFGTRDHATLVLGDDPATRMPVYFLTDHAPPHRATTDWLLYNRVHAQEVAAVPAAFHGRIARVGLVLNKDQAEALHDEVEAAFGPRCHSHSIYSPHYDCQIIELFHPAVDKWTGLTHLSDALGMGTDGIVAVGDDVNDVAMLRGAPLSFAMGNAVPEVLAAAKQRTADQRNCGLAQVIDGLLAGKWG